MTHVRWLCIWLTFLFFLWFLFYIFIVFFIGLPHFLDLLCHALPAALGRCFLPVNIVHWTSSHRSWFTATLTTKKNISCDWFLIVCWFFASFFFLPLVVCALELWRGFFASLGFASFVISALLSLHINTSNGHFKNYEFGFPFRELTIWLFDNTIKSDYARQTSISRST